MLCKTDNVLSEHYFVREVLLVDKDKWPHWSQTSKSSFLEFEHARAISRGSFWEYYNHGHLFFLSLNLPLQNDI